MARKVTTIVVVCVAIFCTGYFVDASMNGFPTASADGSESSQADIIECVMTYIETKRKNDPFMEVEPGVLIKRSNVEGIRIDGVTYYYSLFPHMSFDPVTRGEVNQDEVRMIYEEDETQNIPIVIYTLK